MKIWKKNLSRNSRYKFWNNSPPPWPSPLFADKPFQPRSACTLLRTSHRHRYSLSVVSVRAGKAPCTAGIFGRTPNVVTAQKIKKLTFPAVYYFFCRFSWLVSFANRKKTERHSKKKRSTTKNLLSFFINLQWNNWNWKFNVLAARPTTKLEFRTKFIIRNSHFWEKKMKILKIRKKLCAIFSGDFYGSLVWLIVRKLNVIRKRNFLRSKPFFSIFFQSNCDGILGIEDLMF